MKIIKTPQEFQAMTSSEVCILLNNNKSYAITGDVVGVDRKIINR